MKKIVPLSFVVLDKKFTPGFAPFSYFQIYDITMMDIDLCQLIYDRGHDI